ncbi:heavy metal translocating P-type ATPase [Peptoniphilus sp. KCTC 25270]|uniref:heavy metal translocating P-type ATPase n=1 Tax=Peptoniphilus sp. KCTC 25270 TaxID=2897414 RepID=UPI001E51C80A|nr:heavy metal translocating P-type ATPase [Peptoniphilus sp. KCTC 25270]MCD1146516.1 heavy metal translocating P-type ATPase [Peptoniphilus sp. KCTC 25270]
MNQEKKFQVTGMTCSACVAAVEKSVKKLEGIDSVAVNLLTNSMKVSYDSDIVEAGKIIEAVEKAGYEAKEEAVEKAKEKKVNRDPYKEMLEIQQKRLIWSLFLLIPLLYIAMGPMVGLYEFPIFKGHENHLIFALTQMFLTAGILLIHNHYYKNGLQALFRRNPNMDTLIAVGSGAGFLYGIFVIFRLAYGYGHGDMDLIMTYGHELYFESSGTIVVLIAFGKWLEARAKRRTSNAITQLMDLTPPSGRVIRNGEEIILPIEEVVKGDILVLGPGENVPVDGIVTEGFTSIDESALSGESIPVEKHVGDKIMAATTNGGGRILFEATSVGEDTTISKIIALVEDANATKAPISKLADRISGIFVPIVMGISLITFLVWMGTGQGFEFSLRMAIAVLVISCPCALGLATPVAIMVGTGLGAKGGVLFKSAESLEILHHVDTIVLDKTGTITRGKPFVTDVFGVEKNPKDLLALAYALEKNSEHPLADAVVRGFETIEEKGEMKTVENFQAIPGKGLEGTVEGKRIFAGNKTLMEENGISLELVEEELSLALSQGKTPLFFGEKDHFYGWIAAKDLVKESSLEALKKLQEMGKETVMLTGDNEKTAKAVGESLPIDKIIAEVLPQEKESYIREFEEKGKKVAMVGDGINDAPALARADVGIAIGAGTDIAMESADLVLMKSNLLDVVEAIRLSENTIRNIKQNLFWAFFYNVICIPVAAGVFYPHFGLTLNPMIAAFAMSISSLFVVSNALRLNLVKIGNDSSKDESLEEDSEIHFHKKELQEEKPNKKERKQMEKRTLELDGLSCNHCVMRVEKILNDMKGIEAKVTLDPQEAVIFAEDLKDIKIEEIQKQITEAGYDVKSVK